MLKTQQSQQMFLTQKMDLNLSILQMNRVALNILLDKAEQTNPLIKSTNKSTPWGSKASGSGLIEDILSYEKTLYENLKEELLLDIDESDHAILYLIIGNLSPSGFLLQNISKLCQGITTDINKAEKIRVLIQNSSYLGLASYNSTEYLLFMVKHYFGETGLEYKIAQILPKYKHISIKKLEKLLPEHISELSEALNKVKKINPTPLIAQNIKSVYPDITVSLDKGHLITKLSPYSMPTVEIKDYEEKIYSPKELKSFLKEATALQKALELRKDSLLKNAEALILMRSDFFIDSETSKQIQLKDIANITQRHISTVSRTLKDRYFLFNNIIYPFSILWNRKIGDSDRHSVKKIIQKLITNETETLSDTLITEILNKKGIKIARRTVTKYRQELQINSLYQR